jgi:hypothetical protein
MAVSIIDLGNQYLPPEVVNKLSGVPCESPSSVGKTIGAGIPSIPAGLLNEVSTSGARRLFDVLKREPSELSHQGGLNGGFGNISSMLSGADSTYVFIKYGQTLPNSLYGSDPAMPGASPRIT